MKIVYLDKRERVKAWLTAPRVAAISAAALFTLLLPIWPDVVNGRFTLEPTHKAIVRAEVPGTVAAVEAREGERVSAGQPLVQLTNLKLESTAAQANADLHLASERSYDAMLHYGNFGASEYKRQEMVERGRSLTNEMSKVRVTTPISGIVVTPRLENLVGSYLEAGTPIAEVADPLTLTARIYIPEFDMKDVRLGAQVRLQPRSHMLPLKGSLASIAPDSTEIEPGLIPKDQLKGITPPRFYVGSVLLNNSSGDLREGMTGNAKILVARRSIAGLTWVFTRDLVERRIW